jgi:hypothetical protein
VDDVSMYSYTIFAEFYVASVALVMFGHEFAAKLTLHERRRHLIFFDRDADYHHDEQRAEG